MKEYTREEAGMKPPSSPFEPMPNMPVSVIVLHHSATQCTDDGAQDARNIDQGERARGYIAMAYHVLIHKFGDRFQGRISGGKIKLGAATKNRNSDTLAICLDGNFQFDIPTPEALESAAQKIADWVKEDATRANFVVEPHKNFFNTACPGINLLPYCGSIALRAHQILGNAPVAPLTPVVVPVVSTVPFPLLVTDWYGETDTNKNSYGYVHGHSGKYNQADRPAIIKIQEKVGSPYRDGIIDPGGATAQAIYNFQKAHGLNADKKVGTITWHVMFS